MPNGMQGFAALGDILTGGAERRAEVHGPKRLEQNYSAFDALNKARISRAQALARESLPSAIATSGIARPELASAILGMATGQPNLGSLTEGYKDLGDIELDRQITDALGRGDQRTAQNLSAVKTDKVLPTLGDGGNVVFTPVTGDVKLTPLGEADMAATTALGTQRLAGAEKTLRAPAPKGTLSAPEAEAKVEFILQEGTRLGKDRGDAWAQAWMKDQAAKAGIVMPFELGGDGVVGQPVSDQDLAGGSTPLGEFPETGPLIDPPVRAPAFRNVVSSSSAVASAAPMRVTTEAQFRALPPGTRFIAPDGAVRIKP